MDRLSPMNGFPTKSMDLRLLVVEIINAVDLLPCTNAGDSNPHLSVCLLDLANREIKSESCKAVPQFKTLSPTWNACFEFGKNISFMRPPLYISSNNFYFGVHNQARYIISTTMEICPVFVSRLNTKVDLQSPIFPWEKL